MSQDSCVAVFWDYENCSPPSSISGYDIINNIREIAHRFGVVKQFKAYLDLNDQSSQKSLNMRSELQACGVTLTDCPHNGRKEVADKMMIVDMLAYAIDTPAPSTLILITGDRDFAYAAAVLRFRKYRIVLVTPRTTNTGLKSQASELLDWDTDVLGKPSLVPQTPYRPPSTPSYGFDRHRGATSTDALHGTAERAAQQEGNTYSPMGHILVAGQDPLSPGESLVDRSTSPGFPSDLSASDALEVSALKLRSAFEAGAQEIVGDHGPKRVTLSNVWGPSRVTSSRHDSVSSDLSALSDAQPTLSTASSANDRSPPLSSLVRLGDGFWSVKSDVEVLNADSALPADRRRSSSSFAPLPFETQAPHFQSIELVQAILTVATADPDLHDVERGDLQTRDDSSVGMVPIHFETLLRILERYRSTGVLSPLRSAVGQALLQSEPALYRTSGFRNFASYTAHAESIGMVTLGGFASYACISLNRSWYDIIKDV